MYVSDQFVDWQLQLTNYRDLSTKLGFCVGTRLKLEKGAQGKPSAKYRLTRLVVDAALRRVGRADTAEQTNCKYLR